MDGNSGSRDGLGDGGLERDDGALELAAQVRRGERSSEELVRRSLDRIAARDGELTAFVSVQGGRALRRARALDRLPAARRAEAPVFHGVPTAVKDIDAVGGAPMRAGSRAFRWVIAPIDGKAARALRAAGHVLVGKTTTSELAILPVTEPDTHPPTRNPWDPSRSAGGSSGGAGAAVAGGMLPVAHAADGAGSIRIPASCCGLFGHKPSRGLLPSFYPADKVGLSMGGCVSRTVRDAAATLDVLRGRTHPHRERDSLLSACERDPGRLRIRVCRRSPLTELDPAVQAAIESTAAGLAELGHEVVEGPPLAGAGPGDFLPIMQHTVAAVPVPSEGRLQPFTAWMRREGRAVPRAEAYRLFDALRATVDAWFAGEAGGRGPDLVLLPLLPGPPPPVGLLEGLGPEQVLDRIVPLGAFTAAFNVSGQPAASLPVATHPGGLPLGVQLLGPRGRDDLVLAVARQWERARGWASPARQPASPGPS